MINRKLLGRIEEHLRHMISIDYPEAYDIVRSAVDYRAGDPAFDRAFMQAWDNRARAWATG